jgi:8-oxo-dGTP pyrophosphatase MutT (NUDIX family)
MAYPVRQSIKIILLNDADELLLMCMDDPKTMSIDGGYRGHFWTLIGGQIEANETVLEAAIREVFEETGICKEEIQFGPLVWFGEFDMILHDIPIHIRQQFIVARTKRRSFSLTNLTQDETEVVKYLEWFSYDRILNSGEQIYPVLLPNYLQEIIAGKYPEEPLEIDLAAEAKN